MTPGIGYRHKKTGDPYLYLALATDQSAGMNGRVMVVYSPQDQQNAIYVRKQTEFDDIFEPIEEPDS